MITFIISVNTENKNAKITQIQNFAHKIPHFIVRCVYILQASTTIL